MLTEIARRRFLRAIIGVAVLAAATAIGAKVQMIRAQRADTPSVSHHDDRLALFAESRIQVARIVMVGDSLTESAQWDELTGCPNIVNRGIGSDTARGVEERLAGILDLHPKLVAMMIGVNDVAIGVPPGDTVATIARVADRIHQAGALVVVHYVLPVAQTYWRRRINTTIADLDDQLGKALGERNGVELLDLRPGMVNPEGQLRDDLTLDGIHLRAKAYGIWRDALSPYIDKACQP